MLDLLKRKKPHTQSSSSSQPTLVVASMPSSQSTLVVDNYDQYASMPSSQPTLVGDNYASYASMPSSKPTLVGDNYASIPKSSQLVGNYFPMTPSPHNLRRETRKIKDHKKTMYTLRDQYLADGGAVIRGYPKELPRLPIQHNKSIKIVEKRLGEVPDRFQVLYNETVPIKEDLMYAPIKTQPSAKEYTERWVRAYKENMSVRNKKLREKYLEEEVSIPRHRTFLRKVSNGEEPDRMGDNIFGRLSIQKGVSSTSINSVYDSGFLMVDSSNDSHMHIPYHQGKTQTVTSRYDPGPVPLTKTYDTPPHGNFIYPRERGFEVSEPFEKSRMSYILPGIREGCCWVHLLNLSPDVMRYYLEARLVWLTYDQLKEMGKRYGISQYRLSYSTQVQNNRIYYHIERHSEGEYETKDLWKMLKQDSWRYEEVYVGGKLFWWGKLSEHRSIIPREVMVNNNHGLDMSSDILIHAPEEGVHLHNTSSSILATMIKVRKCDYDYCDNLCVGITVIYNTTKAITHIAAGCALHMYIPMCEHTEIFLRPERQCRVFLDFEDDITLGTLYQNIVENNINYDGYYKNECREMVVRKPKLSSKLREQGQRYLDLRTLVEWRVILCMYIESEKVASNEEDIKKEIIKFIMKLNYIKSEIDLCIVRKVCNALGIEEIGTWPSPDKTMIELGRCIIRGTHFTDRCGHQVKYFHPLYVDEPKVSWYKRLWRRLRKNGSKF